MIVPRYEYCRRAPPSLIQLTSPAATAFVSIPCKNEPCLSPFSIKLHLRTSQLPPQFLPEPEHPVGEVQQLLRYQIQLHGHGTSSGTARTGGVITHNNNRCFSAEGKRRRHHLMEMDWDGGENEGNDFSLVSAKFKTPVPK